MAKREKKVNHKIFLFKLQDKRFFLTIERNGNIGRMRFRRFGPRIPVSEVRFRVRKAVTVEIIWIDMDFFYQL